MSFDELFTIKQVRNTLSTIVLYRKDAIYVAKF